MVWVGLGVGRRVGRRVGTLVGIEVVVGRRGVVVGRGLVVGNGVGAEVGKMSEIVGNSRSKLASCWINNTAQSMTNPTTPRKISLAEEFATWSRLSGSNRGPAVYKTAALPLS